MNYVPDKTMKEMFWTGTSRLNRLRFLKRNLALMVIFFITFMAIFSALSLSIALNEIFNNGSLTNIDENTLFEHPAILIAIYTVQVFGAVLSYKLDVRRLKDLGKDNKIAIVGFVCSFAAAVFWPIDILTIIIALYLLFTPGQKGENQYGPDPLGNE